MQTDKSQQKPDKEAYAEIFEFKKCFNMSIADISLTQYSYTCV